MTEHKRTLGARLNHVWRVVGTGLGFGMFGVGGLLIGASAPVIKLIHQSPDKRAILAQKMIKYSFRGFIESLKFLGVMTYEVENLDKLSNSYGEIVVANHPTLLDVVMLIAFMPQANCVVKQALIDNPFTTMPVTLAGYIPNADSQTLMTQAVKKLTDAPTDADTHIGSLIIFPEGTRTEKGALLNDFARGWANIALRAGVSVRPVAIRCTPSALTKNEKWYHIPTRPFHLQLKVMDTIDFSDITDRDESSAKQVRRMTARLYDFFKQELTHE